MSERVRHSSERGAFVVLWSLLLVGLFAMVAIVIDLGQQRAAKSHLQSTADLAALAAGSQFSTALGRNPRRACEDAIRYVNKNLVGLATAIDVTGFCSQPG